ncbi:MAG: leucine-rich repeat domain-containing protein [Clostridia bacterium]|nr:leucine-rich repeat domain-containing protein [Clostridia bacterium]
MKKIRTSQIPVILLVGALLLGILSSCVGNAPLVISGDDSKVEQTEAPEVNGGGSFQYALNDDGYYEITGYTPNGTEVSAVTIPEVIGGIEVTSISSQAFYYCTYVKSISIPKTVTKIGDYAFAGCAYLESMTIPDTVKNVGIGLFYNCISLKSATLPSHMTYVPAHTFTGCLALEDYEITDIMTEIGDGAFRDCAALTRVVIPEHITRVGAQAYYNCSALTYFEMKAKLSFVLKVDENGYPVYDENGIRVVDVENSTIGEYMLYRFSPEMDVENDLVFAEDDLGMATYFAHYELDKEPPSLTTETTVIVPPSNN